MLTGARFYPYKYSSDKMTVVSVKVIEMLNRETADEQCSHTESDDNNSK